MADIKILLDKLNEEQIKPVLDTEGPVLVVAGAGSGKTRVLTTRIAYLIMEKHVDPDEIMAITFTNKAAGEMKERLIKIVGDIGGMWVSTIHSMCVKILRRDIDKIGYDRNFSIYDESDKEKVIKRIVKEKNIDSDSIVKSAKNIISRAKNDCLSPSEMKDAYSDLRNITELYEIYEAYENELIKSNALDFDDLLYKTYILLSNKPEVADYYSRRFKYIHIDEFQDTNEVQFLIAEILSKVHGNIFVVGDDDQSIYGWRGAKIENILSFDDKFRGAKVYKLERNYRSTKKILQLANAIIAHNTERRPKELWTENPDGVKIETFVGNDENNEATFAALQIKNLMARNPDLKYKDFAIFMRINALSRAYEQEFLKYNIPYKVFGGFRFFERAEIKDILSYLKLIVNRNDTESFLRAVKSPKRGIGDKTLSELREFSVASDISIFDGCFRLEQTGMSKSAKSKLFNFGMMMEEFISYSSCNKVVDLIDHILETTGYMEQYAEKSEENTSKILNINELKNSAELFARDNPGSDLADFLNSVTLSSDTDDINSDDAVTIATIHASKGLEYKCVFVCGLDNDIIPGTHFESSEEEEERRLMYVAVTRAKERLYLTRAKSRYLYGNRDFMSQSKFLKEVQSVLAPEIKREDTYRSDTRYTDYGNSYNNYHDDFSSGSSYTGSSGYSSSYAKKMLNNNKPVENKSVNYGGFKTGVKVRHKKFGEGTVIDVRGSGDNIIVNVAFQGVGIKALSAKFAPMEII